MERADIAELSALPGALSPQPLTTTGTVLLDDESAHHLRVRRLDVGSALRVTDGIGSVAGGVLTELRKGRAVVELGALSHLPPPPPVRLLVPVADRERMLWLAEKATELGLRTWTPVYWQRSRSVSPRGDGDAFRAKVRARMVGALLQSGGAWLPVVEGEREAAEALAAPGDAGHGMRLLLHPDGGAFLDAATARELNGDGPEDRAVTVAVGPEGGLTNEEIDALDAAGFRRCSLGSRILRFETAAVAALALLAGMRDRVEAPRAGRRIETPAVAAPPGSASA